MKIAAELLRNKTGPADAQKVPTAVQPNFKTNIGAELLGEKIQISIAEDASPADQNEEGINLIECKKTMTRYGIVIPILACHTINRQH